jgi:hypothetical protein
MLAALLLAGGCASSKAPSLPMPSAQAPRIAINKPAPKTLVTVLGAKPTPSWLIQQSDLHVASMLTRWGKDAGWVVVWSGGPEIPITGNGRVDRPDFLSAADVVFMDIQSKGYRLQAKAYADKVLEIRGEER